MSINDDPLYPKYLIWLEDKSMSGGIKEMSKISKSFFDNFKFRYLTNPKLKEKIDKHYKTIERDELIDDLFLDTESSKDLTNQPPPFYED